MPLPNYCLVLPDFCPVPDDGDSEERPLKSNELGIMGNPSHL